MASETPFNKKTYWVVVADESKASIYTQDTTCSPLLQLITLENEASRKKIGDLISDRGGRSFDSKGQGRHTMTAGKTDPKKQAATVFAKNIAERIVETKDRTSNRRYLSS